MKTRTATGTLARLDRILDSKTIRFATKYRLYKFHLLPIPLYVRETWTLCSYEEKADL